MPGINSMYGNNDTDILMLIIFNNNATGEFLCINEDKKRRGDSMQRQFRGDSIQRQFSVISSCAFEYIDY